MSAMMKTRPRSGVTRKTDASDPVTEAEKPGMTAHLEHVHPEAEPLEDSVRDTEAPESWQDWHAEAPDAGKGEPHSLEGEFTHGRSRS